MRQQRFICAVSRGDAPEFASGSKLTAVFQELSEPSAEGFSTASVLVDEEASVDIATTKLRVMNATPSPIDVSADLCGTLGEQVVFRSSRRVG